MVKITLEKNIYPKFPIFSCKEKAKIRSKKNTLQVFMDGYKVGSEYIRNFFPVI
jgi:hypothetical protein